MLNCQKIISTRYYVLILLIFFLALSVTFASAYTEGPINPASGTNVGGIGSEPWLNPDQVTQPGDPYASVMLYQFHTESNYLQGTQYGFNIPTDMVITGIEVTINRMSSAHSPSIHDNVVSLVKNGSVVGINYASDARWPTVMTVATYGGPGDMWDTNWTPADINSPGFGVALATYRDNNGSTDRYAFVDSLQVTVYYAYATTSGVVCGDGSPVMYGESLTCVATVSRLASSMTPGGEVNWTSEHGSFTPNPCVLSGADGVSTCTAEYTPTSVGSGAHTIVATYAGDGYFAPSSDSTTVKVIPRPVTVTADPQTKTYGDPDPELTYQVTQGSLVFGDSFTGTLDRQQGEAAGAYAILQGTLSLSDNYVLTYLGDFLTILKADATCDVSPYEVVYDGNAHTATGECTGVMGEPLETLDLSATTHTLVGTYSDMWIFQDESGNYHDQSGTVGNQITVRFITVTADALSKAVRQPDPVLTFQVTLGSLLPGDNFTGVLVRQAGERIGRYAILQGTLSLPDYYQVTYVGVDFTITGVIYMLPLVMR
jgi:MBG domain (YGX type)/Bacterial Ig-like domain (group 3)